MPALLRSSRCRLTLVLVVAPLIVGGCGSSGSSGSASAGAVKVVATTTQLGDLVRVIGGDRVQVVQVLQPNSDPHEYEPRPDDVRALLDVPLVFESGDGLDAWMSKIVAASGGHPRVVVLAGSNVARMPGETSGEEASRYDPHWWHDPRNVEAATAVIRDALSRVNPSAAAEYARNARTYVGELRRACGACRSRSASW
jgi:zinc/manganese transport system substrate-binding protein